MSFNQSASESTAIENQSKIVKFMGGENLTTSTEDQTSDTLLTATVPPSRKLEYECQKSTAGKLKAFDIRRGAAY